MHKVLVLLASYNGEQWLSEQCDTILNQENVGVTLVASDDCSSDGSRDLLHRLELADPRVELLPQTGRAGSAGKNFYRLIRDADVGDNDYVAFSDQDDIWHADKLNRACEALARSKCEGYSSAVRAFYADGRNHVLRQSPQVTAVDFLFEGAGQGCTFVITKRLFDAAKTAIHEAWPEANQVHHHDWLVYALCRSWAWNWYFDPLPSMEYRQHLSNELGARGSANAILRRWRLLRSGWYARQVGLILRVVSGVAARSETREVERLKASRANFAGRTAWTWMLCRIGRRKAVDRMVLGIAAVLGYV